MADKKPGIFKDPWRTVGDAPKPTPTRAAPVEPIVDASTENPEELKKNHHATLKLKGYGGITLEGTDIPSQVAVNIINCCVTNEKVFEPFLTKYGVVVAQIEGDVPGALYIRRSDNWTLCIPEAGSRDVGLLQLIQALLDIDKEPRLRPLLRKYNLHPFKL